MSQETLPKRKDWYETRERILRTFARMVVEDGIRDASIQQVADRAGIAHRTVYRHFANRQELIDELAQWLQVRAEERGYSQTDISLEEVPAAVVESGRQFDEDADLMKAHVIATWESNTLTDLQRQRTEEIEQILRPVTHHLDETEALAVVALFRYLISSRTWLAMREEFGFTGEQSGQAVGWALEVMLDALRNGARPVPRGVPGEDEHGDQ